MYILIPFLKHYCLQITGSFLQTPFTTRLLRFSFLHTLEVQQMFGSELHAVISLLFLFCPLLNSTLPLKKRSLWSLERALSFPQLPPPHLAPEPQGSTLRLWSTAPKTLTLLTLKVPFGALCPTPVSICPPACFIHCLIF